MDITDSRSAIEKCRQGMTTVVNHVRHELVGVRTSRASVNILDSVQVAAYGTQMPLKQVASLSIPKPTLIIADPFDPSQIGAIEKGVRAANLGLNPSNDGRVVRIPIPSLTDERRNELSKLVHKLTEDGRSSVRQVRRDANEALKGLLKNHRLGEDEERRALNDVQNVTNDYINQIEELQKAKDDALLRR